MIIESKDKKSNEILSYTYMLYFNINGIIRYYYGVRYGNIRIGTSPDDDIFTTYFTSSNVVLTLLKNNIIPFRILIHKTFSSIKDACKFEVNFLTKLNAKDRKDFLNQTNNFDNSLPNNAGRIVSDETRAKISIGSSKSQSSLEYKKIRSDLMKDKWSNPEFINFMKEKNEKYKTTGKSKIVGAKSGAARIGFKYSNEVKLKRSIALKKACESIDMKARALNRKKYICPICFLSNLDGGNFNSHMRSRHDWNKEKSKIFKDTNS